MPIFQDDIEHASATSRNRVPVTGEPQPTSRLRRLEETIRSERCSGPAPEGPLRPITPRNVDEEVATSDRAELIEMLKRGASPTWIPNRHLESIVQPRQHISGHKPPKSSPESPTLLPPAHITPEQDKAEDGLEERYHDGLNIERPRSALHSGDFTTDETKAEDRRGQEARKREEHLAPDGWLATSPPRHFASFNFSRAAHVSDGSGGVKSGASPALSSLASFVYQSPTSPLVQSETNEDMDFSMPLADIGHASARRHTLYSTHHVPLAAPSPSLPIPPRSCSRRRDGALPYQAHQPRRSLTTTPSFFAQQCGSTPPTPASYLQSRRMSMGSDTSPLHHASMVGSYEESILRGRMSTTPSRPIEFLAQIGVLGRGKCKSSLRCPPHVTLAFPAVYYSYSNTSQGRRQTDDGPSPYVGQIDLENGLSKDEEAPSLQKAQRLFPDGKMTFADADTAAEVHNQVEPDHRATKPRRRSRSPKTPPGGSYRIPEQGQIQIIIKNQNKTAVKLFLIPYDLSGMAPGTKTFIRQRSYSAGPIVDLPHHKGPTDQDRPILRYLIHLHICSPSRGRYFLYKSIRIVFANRVPDGKEKLRNETTWPDPRFTPYKPVRLMPLSSLTSSGAVVDKTMRRRSLGVTMDDMAMLGDVEQEDSNAADTPSATRYEKRSKTGYAGNGEGLLSQRLRGVRDPEWTFPEEYRE